MTQSSPPPGVITGHPPAEVDLTVEVVRGLLRVQHPDLADDELRAVDHGWDNALFRLGEALVVRLPRRRAAAELVEHEQRWLPVIAPRLPVEVPVPVRVGIPGATYPWRWSICRWIDGVAILDEPSADPASLAEDLGAVLAALHRPAPVDAPHNPFRGVDLSARAEVFDQRLDVVEHLLDAGPVRSVFAQALEAPRDATRRWLHGDLHPDNVLVRHGRLTALLDFGDMCGGDRASDLAAGWMLFDDPADRRRFRDAAGVRDPVDGDTWTRARGWAVALAVAFLATSAESPTYARLALDTLHRATTDPDRT